jgi:transposase
MAKGYSTDLRDRVVALVEAGESRREAARLLDFAASTTIRWMDRWRTTGRVGAKPGTGHCRSLLKQHEQWLLDLVTAESDLTLDEIGTRLASAKRLKVGRTSICPVYSPDLNPIEMAFSKLKAALRKGAAGKTCWPAPRWSLSPLRKSLDRDCGLRPRWLKSCTRKRLRHQKAL